MNWETFYLVCFVVGFAYTAFSFLSGTLNVHLHVPHHFHVGHGAGHHGGGGRGSSFGFFNPITMAAFLAWFGGKEYLLLTMWRNWVFVRPLFCVLLWVRVFFVDMLVSVFFLLPRSLCR
jgi:hypothetical protein